MNPGSNDRIEQDCHQRRFARYLKAADEAPAILGDDVVLRTEGGIARETSSGPAQTLEPPVVLVLLEKSDPHRAIVPGRTRLVKDALESIFSLD
jgi:hypothetical protein